jgi:FMN reductase
MTGAVRTANRVAPRPGQDAGARPAAPADRPHIVIVGGTMRPGSTSERLARHCGQLLQGLGASTVVFPATALELPMYAPERATLHPVAQEFIRETQRCDGMVIASPGYHGGISGLLKNALDYIEELRTDARPYLHGRAVGCIVTAAGWQGANSTLAALRSVVHALRGWPTPLGVAVNSTQSLVDAVGELNPDIAHQLGIMARQILQIAQWREGGNATSAQAAKSPAAALA